MESDLTRELKDAKRKRTLALPKKGRTSKSLLADLKKRGAKENKKWEEGLVSGAVYCGEEEVREGGLRDETWARRRQPVLLKYTNPLHSPSPILPQHTDLLNAAYAAFSLANPLHPDIWPSVNQFEAEIVSMTASLMNGQIHGLKDIVDTVVGCISSGGTESIVLAAKAHREFYCKAKGIKHPEIIR